ncbi:EamA family transporter RarD [Gallaecimonas kandeliae]|uniref:EamA family transporter RarD n=1 Tax=Gallaecimonas kandeliae TaxID=3029055 RepID=UPI002648D538|nr:EamA family transporter RarD [Gallaecimonas kandeliae]WKE65578.1 EamA family transporter RarD [Gallaecimonas kandeliae]
MSTVESKGSLYAVAAYTMWGIAPAYFKLIQQVPATEILTHRVIWSCLLLAVLLLVLGKWGAVRQVLKERRQWQTLMLTACFIATNWGLFIWAINSDHMLDASLGYYINPLVNVALGMLFLGERLRRLQWLALGLAAGGVAIQLIAFGSLPWIALVLAVSFGLYGLFRKKVPVDPIAGLFVETVLLLPAALLYLNLLDSPTAHLTANPWQLNGLLVAAGLVTTVPLLCFIAAARSLPLSVLGFFQYIGPSLTFLMAVFLYGEAFDASKMLTFGFIWGALLLFILDAVRQARRR